MLYGLLCPPIQICSENPDKLTCIINTFKNEVTTDQKGKLLLNTCGILFYCRNGEKSAAIKRMQTVQGSLLRFFFYLTLNIQVNNFSVLSAHSTKIKMRGSREGWQRVLVPSLESRKPLGLFSSTGPDPLEN